MERRNRRWVDEDPFARRLREMRNEDLLRFFVELTSVFPRSHHRKSDIRLAQSELKRRMRKYCIVGTIKRNAKERIAIAYK